MKATTPQIKPLDARFGLVRIAPNNPPREENDARQEDNQVLQILLMGHEERTRKVNVNSSGSVLLKRVLSKDFIGRGMEGTSNRSRLAIGLARYRGFRYSGPNPREMDLYQFFLNLV